MKHAPFPRTSFALLVCALAAGAVCQSTQAHFASADGACEALRAACEADDSKRLLEILGGEHSDLVVTEDAAQDREVRRRFVARCAESLSLQEQDDGAVVLILGEAAWPFPIPLIKEAEGWRFDTAAGKEELVNRRIGENELTTIAACRYYVEAQVRYASADRDGDGVREYAQRLTSSVGKHDGLYWAADTDAGEEESPLGPVFAAAGDYTQGRVAGEPWFGYRYRILTRQGDGPPGGAYSYVIGGNMIGGFALIAYPADPGSSGVMTFLVSHHGKVYEKNLGPATSDIVGYIKEFDPDETWNLVTEE